AFLVGEPTVAQRLTRAKRTLREARADFEVPAGAALRARLPDVLEVVYLIFNEGYSASSGERWVRGELCDEAMRLGRMLAALAPQEAETHGLVALARAESLGGMGPYVIQAALAACHARAPIPEDTDWLRIASLYAVL